MKIVDCFIFYNELDLLNYRLNILDSVVDHFVIIEATHTFSGKEKPLIYNDNKHFFEKYAHKITHIIVDDMPHKYPDIDYAKKDQWSNEYHQRNCIDRGIKKLKLKDEDIIIITDVDEIVDPRIIQTFQIDDGLNSYLQNEIVSLEMDMYYYNLKLIESTNRWVLPKMISFNLYKNISQHLSCSEIRIMNTDYNIPKTGWHLSYFGDIDFIKNKIQNFSHQEFNAIEYTNDENISNAINMGCDLFKRHNFALKKIEIAQNQYLPYEYEKYLQKYIYNA